MSVRIRLVGLLAGAALLGAACSDGSSAAEPTTVLSVGMRDLAFQPATLTVRKNESARLEFHNDAGQLHDFSVERMPVTNVRAKDAAGGGHRMGSMDKYAMHVAVDGGKTGSIDFQPTEAGNYEFYCTVMGHREAGMRGTLYVQ